jgi:hypothetical protein
MRCGSKIINVGATKNVVQESCGEPEKVEQGAPYSEVWVYNFGSDRFVYYLTFEGIKLSRIQTGDRGN